MICTKQLSVTTCPGCGPRILVAEDPGTPRRPPYDESTTQWRRPGRAHVCKQVLPEAPHARRRVVSVAQACRCRASGRQLRERCTNARPRLAL